MLLVVAVAAVAFGATPVVKKALPAVASLFIGPADGLFEIESAANATDDLAVTGDDWQTLAEDATEPFGNSQAFTGIIDDFCGASGCDDVFTGGSKDDEDINEWVVDPTFNAPDKDEIVNAYAAQYIRNDGHLILTFGAERFDASGDAQIGFWFLQGVTYDETTGTFEAIGGGTPVHVPGDTLVLSHFSNGGGLSTIRVYEWVGGTAGDEDCGPGTTASPLNCLVPGPDAIAAVNTAPITVYWPTAAKGQPECTVAPCTVPTGHFFEGSIDLTGILGTNNCFTTFIAESRSSTSVSAELKDIVGGSFETCKITVTKSASPDTVCKDCEGTPGSTTYHYEVCNDGFQTLTDVQLIDDNGTPGNTGDDFPINGTFTLLAGECKSFDVPHVLPDLGEAPYTVTNTVTATATVGVSTLEATAEFSVEVLDCEIDVTKQCDSPTPGPGEQLNFSGTVTNTGDADLTGVTVVDDHAGTVFGPADLAAGQSAPFSGSYPAVLPGSPPCESTNTVTATGDVDLENVTCEVSDSASATCAIDIDPALSTTVQCTNILAGGSSTITGTVCNDGDVALVINSADITVDGGAPIPVSVTDTTLDPGQCANIVAGTTVTPDGGGDCSFTVVFQAHATPNPNCDGVSTGSITDPTPGESTCLIASDPEVSTSVQCTDVEPGGSSTITGTVCNDGDVALVINSADITVNGGAPIPVSLTDTTLDPGQCANIVGGTTVTPSLADGCDFTVVLQAHATPDPNCGSVPTGSITDPTPGSSTCEIDTDPEIRVTVRCTDAPFAGDPIIVSGAVSNFGDVELTGVDVIITANLNGTTVNALTNITLAAGASQNFSVPFNTIPAGQCSTFDADAQGTANPDCEELGTDGVTATATTPTACCVPEAGEGCTPGYWKNHEFAWDGVNGVDPNDVADTAGFEFDTLFFKYSDTAHTILNPNGAGFFDLAPGDVDPVFAASAGYPNGYPLTLTMDQALHLGGGNPHKMIRHTIAALLNLAAGLDYDIPDSCTKTGAGPCVNAAGIKAEFEARIIQKKYSPFASDLADANQLGDCPCDVTGCP